MDREEIDQRLALIERMIAEGRRDTEYWGWAFVLWGAGHLAALAASAAGVSLAWPIAMSACGVLMGVEAGRRARRRGTKSTSIGRALAAVWISLGIAMFVAGFIGGASGFLSGAHIVVAFFLLMGAASFASGLMLRWRWWAALGAVWWAAAAAAMVSGSPAVILWIFVSLALVGEVGVGAALMILERREGEGAA